MNQQRPEIPATCDYRNPLCASTGLTLNGRWVCLNHAPETASQSERIARLEAENRTLREENASLEQSLEAQAKKFEGCPHSFGGSYDHCCACSYDRPDDVCAAHAPLVKSLRAQLEAMSRPVTDEEWKAMRSRVGRDACGQEIADALIAARTGDTRGRDG